MGDTGSTYLGLLIAFFAIATIASGWLSLSQWLILPATFLADSLTTLGRRCAASRSGRRTSATPTRRCSAASARIET